MKWLLFYDKVSSDALLTQIEGTRFHHLHATWHGHRGRPKRRFCSGFAAVKGIVYRHAGIGRVALQQTFLVDHSARLGHVEDEAATLQHRQLAQPDLQVVAPLGIVDEERVALGETVGPRRPCVPSAFHQVNSGCSFRAEIVLAKTRLFSV